MRLATILLALCCAATPARAAWLDRLDRGLGVASRDGVFRADLSGLVDLEGYYIDRRPPGLIFGSDTGFVNPRLTLFLDTRAGRHLYGFVEARFDRGFDPRSRFAAAHLDAYLLRWTPLDDARLNFQAGKVATLVGSWVPRHDSWNNPFINAPLPYENVTIITDGSAPADLPTFLARRNVPDKKRDWVPIIWGPSYTSGAAVFGRFAHLDYAAEVKNAALSARPQAWDATERGFDEPTASGRLGWRPAPAWVLGASVSSGPYLRDRVRQTLGTGQRPGDFRETLFGADASFAWRHLQLWTEFFATRFEVPLARSRTSVDADTAAWYVEGRYKFTPEWYGALRWNQQFFADVPDGRGGERAWDRNAWRVDTAIGYRFHRRLQAKLQYDIGQQAGRLQQGEQLVAAQLTLRF